MTTLHRRLLIAIALFSSIFLGSNAYAQSSSWTVSESQGEVSILKDGISKVAVKGIKLSAGESIKTGANGRAVITRGQQYVVVSRNSHIKVAPQKTKSLLTQFIQYFGNAMFKVDKRKDQHFAVETPYMAAVVKGTTFNVSVSPEGATVQVTEGAVEVATLDGGATQLLLPGDIGLVERNNPFSLDVRGRSSRRIESPNKPTGSPSPKAAPTAPAASSTVTAPKIQEVRVASVDLGGLTNGLITGQSPSVSSAGGNLAQSNSPEDKSPLLVPDNAVTAINGNANVSEDNAPSGPRNAAPLLDIDLRVLDDDGNNGRGNDDDNPGNRNGNAGNDGGNPSNGNGNGRDNDDNPGNGNGIAGNDDDNPGNRNGNAGNDDGNPGNGNGNGRDDDDDDGNPGNGNGNGNGNGRDDGDDDGNPGNGNGNGNGNGRNDGDDDGNPGNGNGNGNGNGRNDGDDDGNPGNGNGNGNGRDDGDDDGNPGNGNGNGNGNGRDDGDDDGNPGNGNGNGRDDGDDDGNPGNGNGNGNGRDDDDDDGNPGNGNGNGRDDDDDDGNPGNGNGNGRDDDDDDGNPGNGNGNGRDDDDDIGDDDDDDGGRGRGRCRTLCRIIIDIFDGPGAGESSFENGLEESDDRSNGRPTNVSRNGRVNLD
ncbi:FecR family protein [Parasphingorhabdus sp. DH2-15]|uniref:FecR family protein n=1 Tax=Parasphingorhabdus sp. DH2-15 TaxID=3444112 RepID=UPI003F6849A4